MQSRPSPNPYPDPSPSPSTACERDRVWFLQTCICTLPTTPSLCTDNHVRPINTFITASSSPNVQTLSPRALEKRPARVHRQSQDKEVTAIPQVPELAAPPASIPPRPLPTYRRSFLQSLLARQQNKEEAHSPRAGTTRVLNPINYVPRPTPVQIPVRKEVSGPDRRSLLSIPEQRRSRHNSPHTSTGQFEADKGHRTSVGLPYGAEINSPEFDKRFSMPPPPPPEKDRRPKRPTSMKEPEKARLPRMNSYQHNDDHDLEAQRPPGTAQSALGSSYGFNFQDQPTQPPRRVPSEKSLNRVRSLQSIRSSLYSAGGAAPLTDARAPPPIPDKFANHPNYAQDDENEDSGSDPEEIPWGPSHPCFPHMNVHVPVESPEYQATRIIRIRRDWMVVGDLAPTYSNVYPEILDPLLPEAEFRFILQHINTTLVEAFDPFSPWNIVDGVLGLLTGWFYEDFRPWGIKGKLKNLEQWIEDWNHQIGSRDGVKIIPLRRTGYLNLDIQIPDPQVRVIGEGEEYDDDKVTDAQTERQESILQLPESRGHTIRSESRR